MYIIQKGLAITIGSFILAVGINMFLTPYEILDGGIIGLSLILHYLFRLKIGLMIILLSLPIFILAWFKYRDYFYNSLHGLLVSSFTIDFTSILLNAIYISPFIVYKISLALLLAFSNSNISALPFCFLQACKRYKLSLSTKT